MTYEEARNLIDEMRAEIKAKHMCRSMDGECTSEEVAEYRCRFAALSMAVEAVEKQIPNKVISKDEKGDGDFYWLAFICPTCDEAVIGQPYKPNHCKHCGQALDWGE